MHLLDYVAGNVRSLVNAIEKLGYQVEWVRAPQDIKRVDVSDVSSSLRKILPSYMSCEHNEY